jgi:hypothetical protein
MKAPRGFSLNDSCAVMLAHGAAAASPRAAKTQVRGVLLSSRRTPCEGQECDRERPIERSSAG